MQESIAESTNMTTILSKSSLNFSFIFYFTSCLKLITFAGIPPTIAYAGTSFVTTALAAITAPLPICTFGKIVALSPIQTLSSMITGPCETTSLNEGCICKDA